jgi:hypothetical protein
MDPYLEPHWLDVHGALIGEARRCLNALLPSGLVARMEERLVIDSENQMELRAGPDVFVYEPGSAASAPAGTVTIDAPICLEVEMAPVKQRYVRILNLAGQLITVVEFLSPSNKMRKGIEAYRTKRDELLAAGVHLVEIDLVRQGNWRALMQTQNLPAKAVSTYRVTVRDANEPAKVYLYPINLQDTLPEIHIPLRPGDAKLMLPLQPMIDAIYTDGRYGQTIDYTQPLDLELSSEDQKFADRCLAVTG